MFVRFYFRFPDIVGLESTSERSIVDDENDLQRHSDDTDSGFSEDNSVKMLGSNAASSAAAETTEGHPTHNQEVNGLAPDAETDDCQRKELPAAVQCPDSCQSVGDSGQLCLHGDHCNEGEPTSPNHSNGVEVIVNGCREETACPLGDDDQTNLTPNGFDEKDPKCENSAAINGFAGEPNPCINDADSDEIISVSKDSPNQGGGLDGSFSALVDGLNQMSLDNASVSGENVTGKSVDCNVSAMLNDVQNSSSPRVDSTDRNKRTARLERRHRAMLAAMQTAGVRQKPAGRECSLTACLLQFTAVETLCGNNMLACSTCNSAGRKINEVSAAEDGSSSSSNG